MRMPLITLLFAALLGGALTLGILTASVEDEFDPCSDPNVNCVRIWKPVG